MGTEGTDLPKLAAMISGVKALGENGDLRGGIETAAALLPRLRALA